MKWIAAGPGGCSCLCVKRLQSTSHSTALLCIQSCWFGHRHIIQNVPSEPGLAWDNWIKILLLDNRVCHSQTRISFQCCQKSSCAAHTLEARHLVYAVSQRPIRSPAAADARSPGTRCILERTSHPELLCFVTASRAIAASPLVFSPPDEGFA